jgi:hypothetical protein
MIKAFSFCTLNLAADLAPFMYESATPEPVQYDNVPQRTLGQKE